MTAPALADAWYEHYEKGESALQRQDWEEAVRQLTQALQRRGEPGIWVRTRGTTYVNYLPYLKLGIAYFNMSQYELALASFDTEENFGAIARSEADLKNLQTLRELARSEVQKKREASREPMYAFVETITTTDAEGKEQKVEARYYITGKELVSKGLELSRAREEEGDLVGAISALGASLAVRPDDSDLLAALERLRQKVAEEERARERRESLSRAIEEGRDLLAAGEFESASSRLQQALALDPQNELARDLLAVSQARLLEKIEAERSAESRRILVREGLDEALRLESAGRLDDALERLQSILAVEPGNARALELQDRLARARGAEEAREARVQEIARLLDEGVGHLMDRRYEQSVGAFNRLIALDPGNESARSYLARVYAAMSEELLAGTAPAAAPKLPPVIALANVASVLPPADTPDGEELPEERVTAPDFTVSGLILDDQPDVKITFQKDVTGSPGETEEVALLGEKTGNLYQYRFARAFELDRGLSLVRVTASDPDGFKAEIVHRVRYVVPIWRSPWLYAASGLVLVTALGAVQGYRIHRRNRLLKRRFNPYVAGAPVLDDDLFMGREALLSRILQTIHNNSILLYGERRIGKTSLQHHLKKRLLQVKDPEYDFYPVYIDLQGTPQERFFATMAQDIFHELSPVLGAETPEGGPEEGSPYLYEAFVRDIRGVLKILKKRTAKNVKLVLLIDEVDELNEYDPKVNQKLRSLFMKSFAEDMVAVVSGVGIKKDWASEGSPWYNFFEEIQVRPFTRQDAEDLVERPIKGFFRLEEGAVDRIIESTDCKPYLIQKLCVALVNRLHEEGRRCITVSDVDAIGRPPEE